jgi:glycerol-3-phosphate O-acyltransferase
MPQREHKEDKSGSFVKGFLNGHHDYYTSVIPQDSGMFNLPARWILKLLFSGVQINKPQTASLNELRRKGIVVFVSKYKSNMEYLFYNVRYRKENLPFPTIGFDQNIFCLQPISHMLRVLLAHINHLIRYRRFPDPYRSGFYKQRLEQGETALLSLVDPGNFYGRFVKSERDPVQYLIELQQEIEKPVYLVPHLLLFSKKPVKYHPSLTDILFGGEDNPGTLRRLSRLLRTPHSIFLEVSEAISLKEFLQDPEHQGKSLESVSFKLRQTLLNRLNRHHHSITGPVLRPREELKELVLRNSHFQGFMKQYATNHGMNIQKVRKKSDEYLHEIGADYNITVIRSLAMLFNWTWHTLFDGVTLDMEGLNRLKSAARKAPVVLVPCHKSHLDYCLISHILFMHNMPCPHVAAGKNLTFWPMGPIFRKCGAFFIRRSFRGAQLYAEVFSEYIRMLVKEGFNMEFFLEGGRSRTGKLLLPKWGFLSILLKAYETGACDEMMFVPIYVGYDQVMEENIYLEELEGHKKKPETFKQLLKARKHLKKRCGRIYLQFDHPISLNDLLAKSDTPFAEMPRKKRHVFYRNLAFRITHRINQISVITPQALTAAAILNYPKKVFTRNSLTAFINIYLEHLQLQRAHLSEAFDNEPHLVDKTLVYYTKRKFINRLDPHKKGNVQSDNASFIVIEEKRPNLEYYKNNSIHFFVPAAYAALAILSYENFQFSFDTLNADYGFLRDLFKCEFVYDVDKPTEECAHEMLAAFVETSILTRHPFLADTYNITPKGLRRLFCFSTFLRTYLESYWIVINTLKKHDRSKTSRKNLIKNILAGGKTYYKRGQVSRIEALSQANYDNALTYFAQRGIHGAEDKEGINLYTIMISKYLNSFTFLKW